MPRKYDHAAQHRAQAVQADAHADHDSEIAAAAAQGPEQLAVRGAVRRHETTVFQHDIGRQQVVQGQPEFRRERSIAATQGESGHADGAEVAGDRDEPVCLGRADHIGRCGAAIDRGDLGERIDE